MRTPGVPPRTTRTWKKWLRCGLLVAAWCPQVGCVSSIIGGGCTLAGAAQQKKAIQKTLEGKKLSIQGQRELTTAQTRQQAIAAKLKMLDGQELMAEGAADGELGANTMKVGSGVASIVSGVESIARTAGSMAPKGGGAAPKGGAPTAPPVGAAAAGGGGDGANLSSDSIYVGDFGNQIGGDIG